MLELMASVFLKSLLETLKLSCKILLSCYNV